jgi:hypothetical protein
MPINLGTAMAASNAFFSEFNLIGADWAILADLDAYPGNAEK